MITINNVANTWLIPSYNRNAVSTYLLNELVKDDFEIEVSVKTDWDMIKKSKQKICLNQKLKVKRLYLLTVH